MFNPMNEAKAIEYHKRDLMRQAKLHHLMREAQSEQARLHERLLTLVADLMISNGAKLKARYSTARAARASFAPQAFYNVKPQSF